MSVNTGFISMPGEMHSPGLRLIKGGGEGVNAPSLFVQAKDALVAGVEWLVSAPGRFWGWLKRVLHLQPAVDKIKAAYVWGANALRSLISAMGLPGLTGLGLLTVSTGPGRWLLRVLTAPVRWVGSMLAKTWDGVENFFTGNLGGFGTWVADRMADVEEFFFGTMANGKPYKLGLFGRVKSFWNQHISRHMATNSVFMRVLRVVGTALFGLQVIAALPLLGLAGSTLVYTTYAAKAVLYATVGWQSFWLGVTIGEMPRVTEWVNKARAGGRKGDAAAAAGKTTGDGRPMVDPATLRDDIKAATQAVNRGNRQR